jgi:hypothetical protein
MNRIKKLSAALIAALGLGFSATTLARDDADAAVIILEPNTSELSSSATSVPMSEPILVFADGGWYSVSDGQLYALSGNNWYVVHDAAAGAYSANGATAAPTTSSDHGLYTDGEFLYSVAGGQLYVWVPVLASELSETPATTGTTYSNRASPMQNIRYVY